MAQNRQGGGGYNVLPLPDQVLNLTATGGPGGITGTIEVPGDMAGKPVVLTCQQGGPSLRPFAVMRKEIVVPTPPAGVRADSFAVGDEVSFLIGPDMWTWLIVHIGKPGAMYSDSCDGVWVLLKHIYALQQWNIYDIADYSNSLVIRWLKDTFVPLLDPVVLSQLRTVKIPYRPGSNGSTIASGESGLECKAFLLGDYEVGRSQTKDYYVPADGVKLDYFSPMTGTGYLERLIATYNGAAAPWWLRSPTTNSSTGVWRIQESGYDWTDNASSTNGVRPALILPRDMLFSATPNADGTHSPLAA